MPQADPIKWPNEAKGAIALTFDNLGETADRALGNWPDDTPIGNHRTASHVVPLLIELLGDLKATFFVEGASAALYPDAVKALSAAGHEVAFHAMQHELWANLSQEQEALNLAAGRTAYQMANLEPAGFRPPGGALLPSSYPALKQAGYKYVSPVGRMARRDKETGVATVPFSWKAVDAYWFEPDMAPVRQHKGDPAEVQSPQKWQAAIESELALAATNNTAATLIFHLFLLDPATKEGPERLEVLKNTIALLQAQQDVWVAPARDIAKCLP
ncbi:MAG: polysaccharide deacetylase family protein [Alphaproteobacteria bacterium]